MLFNYGGNIIVIVIPEDLKEATESILKNICFEGSGKIGLYTVNKKGKVKKEIPYKRINLNKQQSLSGKEKIKNLTFIRDLKLSEFIGINEMLFDDNIFSPRFLSVGKLFVSDIFFRH